MNTPKTGDASDTPNTAESVKIVREGHVPAKNVPPVDVLELTFMDQNDMGSDPYNRTGEQIILKLREDAKR